MNSAVKQYHVSIFPCSEAGDASSSEIYMEIASDYFDIFYENLAMTWIDAFHRYAKDHLKKGIACRIQDGEDKAFSVCCSEEEVILALLYCCRGTNVKVREICYHGDRYTEFSDVRFLEGVADDTPPEQCDDTEQMPEHRTQPLQIHVKKNGRDTTVYLFGPYITKFPFENVTGYPRSCGMVEVEGNRRMYYAGTYRYPRLKKVEESVPIVYDGEDPDAAPTYETYILKCDYHIGVEVFAETNGNDVQLSVLLDGKLYQKISKDEERILFHSVLCDGALLSETSVMKDDSLVEYSFWESGDAMQDVVFQNNGSGEYLYTGNNELLAKRWSGAVFVPPRMPDSLDQASAHALCCDYVNTFYALRAEDRVPFVQPDDIKLWESFLDILKNIHDQHGLTAAEAEAYLFTDEYDEAAAKSLVTPVEVLYAVSQFFLLTDSRLQELFPTKALREKYDLLKASLQYVLNELAIGAGDKVVFRELCEIFSQDFSYFNRISLAWDHLGHPIQNYVKSDADVKNGRITAYGAIFTFGYGAANLIYHRSSDGGYASVLDYYRQTIRAKEALKLAARPDIDALEKMRKDLRAELKSKIRGQDMAIEKFVDGYIRYQLRGSAPGKPAGLYLFAGPPGTGKTYLAETFSKLEAVAGAGYRFRRFDMAAYSGSSDTVSGLVGFEKTWKSAAPGHLTGFVRENPRCILLFDEIEKAGPQVRYLFLSILEGAVLTDKFYDEPVSFENAILIFTTNEGKDLYEDNRETNLTALPDSAVIEGLQASQFPAELISRFMSGSVVMFNHLSYADMESLFVDSVKETVEQIFAVQKDLHFTLEYAGSLLPRLYLLSNGGRIDARFVRANVKKLVEDQFIEAGDSLSRKHHKSLRGLDKVTLSVDVDNALRSYFELTEKPRLLVYTENGRKVYTGSFARMNNALPSNTESLEDRAELVYGTDADSFRELLQNCNWNSRCREDKFDAILIDFGQSAQNFQKAAGCACLKAAVGTRPTVPIIAVDCGDLEDTFSMLSLGVTDFVQGMLLDDSGEEVLALDRGSLEKIFDRQHFVEMASSLVRDGKRISGDTVYDCEAASKELKIRFTNLSIRAAEEEDAASRKQNKKYLLVQKPQVRLEDIFASHSVKEAAKRCIENIRNPEKYKNAGAKLMTGILMYGAPGMGKTMCAKAMAFESGASFISAVGADFLGDGSIAKLEEMFQTARRKRPCILFIDEFDAISKSRSRGLPVTQEIVLEKFLKEMDGLETDNEGVYVVGATNYYLDDLDPAVVRRFSSKIPFPYPTMNERMAYLIKCLEERHLEGTLLPRAARTLVIMMSERIQSYAEIRNFVEESIAEAVYLKGTTQVITEQFWFNRVHRVTYGAVRGDSDYPTIYHEAGHAVLQYLSGRKVKYVTTISRGGYLGYALAEPQLYCGQDFLNQICISFAGRAAETIYLQNYSQAGGQMGINVGANSDLQRATQLAYEYVCRYGLSDRILVVPASFAPRPGALPEEVLPESQKEAIWDSVNNVLAQQWETTLNLLKEHWEEVSALAACLIYRKELEGSDVEYVIRNKVPIVNEDCFDDADSDYRDDLDGVGRPVVWGYPIYPYYSTVKVQPDEWKIEEADRKHYYYVVKRGRQGVFIDNDLQAAFSMAYTNNAVCRRFVSAEAAEEYREMLELLVSRQGERRFFNVYQDALERWDHVNVKTKALIILKSEEDIRPYQEEANAAGMPLAQYLMDLVDSLLNGDEDAYVVLQIHDKGLQEEVLYCMDAMEYHSKRYLKNAGYLEEQRR